jgi:hypothetical protein
MALSTSSRRLQPNCLLDQEALSFALVTIAPGTSEYAALPAD